MDKIEQIEKLNQLKEKGIITQEEFEESKKELLDGLTNASKSKKIDSNYVWALSLAPLIGSIIEALFYENTEIEHGSLWFITLILNIVLSYLDSGLLKKQGYQSTMLDNAWLVPGYLYERARLLNESQMFLWIWTGSLLIALCF